MSYIIIVVHGYRVYFLRVEEFAANVYWALHHDPHPLTPSQRHTLSWEAATERLITASAISREMQYRSNKFTDKFIAWMLEAVS